MKRVDLFGVAIAAGALAYIAIGCLFAVVFTRKGAQRLDPAAGNASRAFRLVIVPGAVMLWPWLALLWRRS